MATMCGNLWEFNLTKVVVVDVSDDYKLMQPPMPSDFYPVLAEMWLPTHNLLESLPTASLMDGYLYDWYETPESEGGRWYVGVVHQDLAGAELPGIAYSEENQCIPGHLGMD